MVKNNGPIAKKTLKEILSNPMKFHYARIYDPESLNSPKPSNGSLIITVGDCTSRRLSKSKNTWAEVNEETNFCRLADCVSEMYGEEFNRHSAYCQANLDRGCCPRSFANPKPAIEIREKE